MELQFKQRLVMGFLSITCLVFIIAYAHAPLFKPFFFLGCTAIINLALMEFYQLAKNRGSQPLIAAALVCSTLYLLATYWSVNSLRFQALPFLVLLGSFLIFCLFFFSKTQNSIVNLSVTTFGLCYLTLPLASILLITYFESPYTMHHGRLWLTYLLVVTKITDMGAYFIGKAVGKHALIRHISPKKTIEGAIGGTLLSIITSIVFCFFLFLPEKLMTIWQSIWMGLSISLLAQIGDLVESFLKRDAGVKDSGHLPGFGGILDVVDSIVFTAPFMYLILQMQLIG